MIELQYIAPRHARLAAERFRRILTASYDSAVVTFTGGPHGPHSIHSTDAERVNAHWQGYCQNYYPHAKPSLFSRKQIT
jgi:hypothetical protein